MLPTKDRERLAEFAGGELIEDSRVLSDDKRLFKFPGDVYCAYKSWLPGDLQNVPWWQIELIRNAVDRSTYRKFTKKLAKQDWWQANRGRFLSFDEGLFYAPPLTLIKAILEAIDD